MNRKTKAFFVYISVELLQLWLESQGLLSEYPWGMFLVPPPFEQYSLRTHLKLLLNPPPPISIGICHAVWMAAVQGTEGQCSLVTCPFGSQPLQPNMITKSKTRRSGAKAQINVRIQMRNKMLTVWLVQTQEFGCSAAIGVQQLEEETTGKSTLITLSHRFKNIKYSVSHLLRRPSPKVKSSD